MVEIKANVSGQKIVIDSINFASRADKLMDVYVNKAARNNKGEPLIITTSKMRNLLDLVNKIYNEVMYFQEDQLTDSQLGDIAYLKVKFAYESSREKLVKNFLKTTHMSELVDDVLRLKTKESFLLYARYVESLIAYFKFHGGKDK